MKPFYYAIGFLSILSLLITACGVRDRVYNPVRFQPTGVLVPPDIVYSGPARAAGPSADGLYPVKADSGSLTLCCWIASSARVRIKKSRPARSLILTGYLPDLPIYRKHHQQFIVTFPNLGGRHASSLTPGFNVVSVAVPKVLRSKLGAVLVQMNCTIPLIVAGQKYGIVLTSAYFE
jgi:hypothetical protein